MPKNEDGEFELILGNRQIFSVFFVVVALFGVFFAMGYIMGHNSGPMTSEAAAKKADKPLVVESPAKDQTAAAQPASTPPEAPPAKASPAPEKAAAPPPEKKSAEKKEEVKKEAKAEPAKQELPKYKPLASTPAPVAATGQPASGATYLQLAAVKKDDAELEADILRKKGFKTLVAQIPEKKELYRVLVGPVADRDMNKTRADLKNAGFPGDSAIKRTF